MIWGSQKVPLFLLIPIYLRTHRSGTRSKKAPIWQSPPATRKSFPASLAPGKSGTGRLFCALGTRVGHPWQRPAPVQGRLLPPVQHSVPRPAPARRRSRYDIAPRAMQPSWTGANAGHPATGDEGQIAAKWFTWGKAELKGSPELSEARIRTALRSAPGHC